VTFEWAADKSKQEPAKARPSNEGVGVWGEFWRAAAYSGLQEPVVGAAQVVDRLTGAKTAQSIQLVDAPPAPKNSLERHAVMFGSAVGSLVPIGLSALGSRFMLGSRFALGKLGATSNGVLDATSEGVLGATSENFLLERGSLGLSMAETGATGAFVGGFLTPTDDAQNKGALSFIADRSIKAGIGAASFAGMSAINAGLASEIVTSRLARVGLSSLARNPVLNGMVAGMPAGGFNAELDSLMNRHQLASTDEVLAGMYQMSLTGGVFGATNLLARSLRGQPTAGALGSGESEQRSASVPAASEKNTSVPPASEKSASETAEKRVPPDAVADAQRHREAQEKILAIYNDPKYEAGSMVSDFKHRKEVVEAFSQIRDEDRYPVWHSVLALSERDPKYSELGRYLSTSFELLPQEQRLSAWNELEKSNRHWASHAMLIAMPELPANDRISAFVRWLPGNENNFFLGDRIKTLPASGLPSVADYLFKYRNPSPDWRDQTSRIKPLSSLAYWTEDMHELPLSERATIADKVLSSGFAHGMHGDEMPLQDIWRNLPEPGKAFNNNAWQVLRDSTAPVEASGTPIRDQLVQKYSPEDLSKVIFSWADPEIVRPFAKDHPDVIRAIAGRDFEKTDPDEIHQIEMITLSAQTEKSLPAVVRDTLQSLRKDLPDSNDRVAARLITELTRQAPEAEQAAAFDIALDHWLNGKYNSTRVNSYVVASAMGEANPELLKQRFLQPIEDRLSSADTPYADKLQLAGRVAALQRHFRLPNMQVALPDLRMPKQDIQVPPQELPGLRSSVEADLHDISGQGRVFDRLGRYFPSVFGDYQKYGGMLGRPQHGIHKFPLQEHSSYVVQNILRNPEFMSLSSKERTDLLWAGVMHDAGKRANVYDPGHEWASANLAWGVLRSLGYASERIQRIAALISRHQEASFQPGAKVAESLKSQPDRLDDLAAFYRYPAAWRQLKILNESDIRSIAADNKYYTPEVAAELDDISKTLQARAAQLNAHTVPVLTSALPQRFKLALMDKSYALLAHVSQNLTGGEFLRQLSLIESPEYSISSSLITDKNRRFYGGGEPPTVVALVSGPIENVSQAWRNNLGTGTRVDWNGHVKLVQNWAAGTDKYTKGSMFAHELDERARQAGVEAPQGELSALHQVRDELGHYDNLDELVAAEGSASPLVRAQQSFHDALTDADHEQGRRDYNEVKLNSPSVVGLGINRNGRPVYLDNMTDENLLNKLLDGQPKPDWLLTGTSPLPQAGVVPENVWREALKRDLPLVILDP